MLDALRHGVPTRARQRARRATHQTRDSRGSSLGATSLFGVEAACVAANARNGDAHRRNRRNGSNIGMARPRATRSSRAVFCHLREISSLRAMDTTPAFPTLRLV